MANVEAQPATPTAEVQKVMHNRHFSKDPKEKLRDGVERVAWYFSSGDRRGMVEVDDRKATITVDIPVTWSGPPTMGYRTFEVALEQYMIETVKGDRYDVRTEEGISRVLEIIIPRPLLLGERTLAHLFSSDEVLTN